MIGNAGWSDVQRVYSQVNNPMEEELRKLGYAHWLQSCGSSAAATGMAVVGWDMVIRCPGDYAPQADQMLNDFLNDPNVYMLLRAAAPWINPTLVPNNRNAAHLPVAGLHVFGARGLYWNPLKVDGILDQLRRGRAVQVCINPPGHYIPIVAFNEESKQFVYHDPWPGRKADWNGNGFARELSPDEVRTIVAEGVVWCPPIDDAPL